VALNFNKALRIGYISFKLR